MQCELVNFSDTEYTFEIDGLSKRAGMMLLNYGAKYINCMSSDEFLHKLKDSPDIFYFTSCGGNNSYFDLSVVNEFLVMTEDEVVNLYMINFLDQLKGLLKSDDINNDFKYCIPDSAKVYGTVTFSLNELKNFIDKKSVDSTQWEIKNIASAIYESLGAEHQTLLQHLDYIEKYT